MPIKKNIKTFYDVIFMIYQDVDIVAHFYFWLHFNFLSSNSLLYITIPKTKENKIQNKDTSKIKPEPRQWKNVIHLQPYREFTSELDGKTVRIARV